MSPLYPLFLNLQGRFCIVVGGSEVAEGKIHELLDADAMVRVIAPAVTEQVAAWSQAGRLQWEPRSYISGDLSDAFLVVSVADPETNAQVFEEAETRRTFCNAVDDIEHCNWLCIRSSAPRSASDCDLDNRKESRFGTKIAQGIRRTVRGGIRSLGHETGRTSESPISG
jgi:hypothetical protein